MKLTKAIANLTDFIGEKREVPYDELLESCNLGIEAMRVLPLYREKLEHPELWLLPGETEE